MMHLERWFVDPFVGVGRVRFGDSRPSCRELLGPPEAVFAKGAGPRKNADAFDSLGLHLVYDEKEELEMVEIFEPAQVLVAGIVISPGVDLCDEVLLRMQRAGHEGQRNDAGYDFPSVGVAVYVSAGRVEAVSPYRRGYYTSA